VWRFAWKFNFEIVISSEPRRTSWIFSNRIIQQQGRRQNQGVTRAL
jgi:hypothetical protein